MTNKQSQKNKKPEDDILKQAEGGLAPEDEGTGENIQEPGDNLGSDKDNFTDLGQKDSAAKQIKSERKKASKLKEPDTDDGLSPQDDRMPYDPERPGVKLSVDEIVTRMATQPEPNEFYQQLVRLEKVANVRATEIELIRLGYDINPRHAEDLA